MIEEFVKRALQQNVNATRILCQHYDKTEQELAKALRCKVVTRKGQNPCIRINFTDNQTGATIKLTEKS